MKWNREPKVFCVRTQRSKCYFFYILFNDNRKTVLSMYNIFHKLTMRTLCIYEFQIRNLWIWLFVRWDVSWWVVFWNSGYWRWLNEKKKWRRKRCCFIYFLLSLPVSVFVMLRKVEMIHMFCLSAFVLCMHPCMHEYTSKGLQGT